MWQGMGQDESAGVPHPSAEHARQTMQRMIACSWSLVALDKRWVRSRRKHGRTAHAPLLTEYVRLLKDRCVVMTKAAKKKVFAHVWIALVRSAPSQHSSRSDCSHHRTIQQATVMAVHIRHSHMRLHSGLCCVSIACVAKPLPKEPVLRKNDRMRIKRLNWSRLRCRAYPEVR